MMRLSSKSNRILPVAIPNQVTNYFKLDHVGIVECREHQHVQVCDEGLITKSITRSVAAVGVPNLPQVFEIPSTQANFKVLDQS